MFHLKGYWISDTDGASNLTAQITGTALLKTCFNLCAESLG